MTDPTIVVRATGDFRRLNSDLSKTEGVLGKFGRTAGRATALGLGIAGAAVVKLGIDSVHAASLSQQSIGATESVFGKYADTVIKRSNEAAEAVGLSANEYRELANVTGAMLSSAGTPLKRVTELTDKLNVRAADMAATFGGETREAVEAISSLLRGETDPIERYGVAIKQSDVNARLAAKGLDELEGSALKQAEQQARLELLFRQTSKAAGQFAEESDTLAGSQARLSAKFEDVKAKAGTLLLPALTELAGVGSDALDELVEHGDDLKAGWDEIRGAVAPAVDEIVEALGNLLGEGDGLSDMFHDKLIPALEITSEVVGGLVNFIDELPGPVKDLGVEVGLAAVAFTYLSGGVAKAQGALSAYVGSAATAATRTAALKNTIGQLAGVGGVLLLAKGMSTADEATGALLTTAGGIATGFAVGGPVGAAIGGMAGIVLGLKDSFTDAEGAAALLRQEQLRTEAMEEYKHRTDDLKSSLDELTGAYTRTTREAILQRLVEEGVIDTQGKGVVAAHTWVDAVLGNEAAIRRVNRAYAGHSEVLDLVQDETRQSVRETRNHADAIFSLGKRLGVTSKELNAIPRNVRIKIRDDVPDSLREIKRLARETGNLDRKTIRILLKAADLPVTEKRIKAIQAELDKTDRKHSTPKLSADDREYKRKAAEIERSIRQLDRELASPASTLTLDQYYRKRAELLASLRSIPDEYVNIWVTRRDTGGSNTASGSTRGTPRLLSDMLGLDSSGEFTEVGRIAAKAERSGRTIIDRLLRGLLGGSSEVRSALDRLTSYIEKRVDLKDDKKERAREKQIIAHLKDEYSALTKIGKAQDRLNRQLERARAHLAEVRAFVDEIKQSFIDTGNVTQLGILGSGRVSAPLLLDQLRDQVEDARRFAELIRELTDDVGAQLNETSLQQLLAAGPDAGLATLEGLVLGGDAAISELNDLTGELGALGDELGSDMSDQFFDIGLNAAIGIVKGLEAQDEALDRAARRLARKLARAVRQALRGLGNESKHGNKREREDALRGLTLGIDETTARDHGRRVAAAMVEGFGSPVLGADIASRGRSVSVSIKLTAEQASQLSRGKELTLDLNAAQGRGVRRLAVTGG